MFDEIVNMVKYRLGNNPQVARSVPQGQEDATVMVCCKDFLTGEMFLKPMRVR